MDPKWASNLALACLGFLGLACLGSLGLPGLGLSLLASHAGLSFPVATALRAALVVAVGQDKPG